MSRVVKSAWFSVPGRGLTVLGRRLRDSLWAWHLHAPGFRAARSPRILGSAFLQLGADFHARDFLWLEAVDVYTAAGQVERFTPRLTIGVSARLSDNVHVACLDRVTVGDHLLCGSGVLITDHAHGSYRAGEVGSDPETPPSQRPLRSAGPVWIGSNVWLGDGVAVLAGAVIGDGCVIGANSVVTGTIPPRTVAVGTPARPIRRWEPNSRSWVPIAGEV